MAKEIESAKKIVEDKVGDKGLDLLINNAAAINQVRFPDTTEDNMLFHFKTNTVGPVTVSKEMFSLLQRSVAHKTTKFGISRSIILNISSNGGSMALKTAEIPDVLLNPFGYFISKAALNMAMRMIALTMKNSGVLVVNMCPGWVKTDMGTDAAELEVSESVSAILETLSQLNDSHHGTFIDRNGKTIPF